VFFFLLASPSAQLLQKPSEKAYQRGPNPSNK
jgi:hypothetical protein